MQNKPFIDIIKLSAKLFFLCQIPPLIKKEIKDTTLNHTISQILNQFIVENFLLSHGISELEQEFPLIEEGIIDSMGIFILINFIREQFGAEIQPADITVNNFENLQTLTALVEFRLMESSLS